MTWHISSERSGLFMGPPGAMQSCKAANVCTHTWTSSDRRMTSGSGAVLLTSGLRGALGGTSPEPSAMPPAVIVQQASRH
eukprot:CAMPEP_0183448340 /NCGR_PEP_ID=MMETSP0370-20130417/105944_1 /TAXON_ID=268820 /ORGANISM="Peridinium aciculiferum, Strain PAER-2" /LENGTH=79 /DNA_ID=CAMNT_0025639293 /DNA_START=256 /DNA_END=493 /DNA_ORIENTATION=+